MTSSHPALAAAVAPSGFAQLQGFGRQPAMLSNALTNERGRVVSERDAATALDAELVAYSERATINLTFYKWVKKQNCTLP